MANLEEVGFPIKYYDEYANPIAKPIFNKAIPDGLTAADVINSYIESIGGKEKLKSVKTIVMKAEVTIPGAPFKPTATSMRKFPNKYSFEIQANMGGQNVTLSKIKFNGERGFNEMQGQKVDFEENQIDKDKGKKGLFDELYFSEDQLELVSINSVNYEDAYKVKVTVDGKVSHRYYSIETGFLVSEEETDDNNNVVTTNYGDYKEVNNVKFPFYMELPAQKLEFSTTSLEVNKDLKDSSF